MRASVRCALWVMVGLAGCTDGPTLKLPEDTDDPAGVDTDPGGGGGGAGGGGGGQALIGLGDLVITEILLDSRVCDGVAGQLVELFNTTSASINLQGLSIGNGLTTGSIGSGTIRPGDYAIGIPVSAGDCHGIGANFTYADVELSASRGGSVELWDRDRLLDLVDIAGWDTEPGVSWNVDPQSEDPTANDSASAWCLGVGPIGATVDSGTPGRTSEECPEGASGGVVSPLTVAEVGVGGLVITEMMLEPESCPASVGQYLEIYNATGRRLSLEGLILSDDTSFATLDQRIQMPVDSYAYLAAGDFSSHCYLGGLLPSATWGSDLVFERDELVSIGFGSPFQRIDMVPTVDLDADRGVALQLSGDRTGASHNDQPNAWCNAVPPITGALDRGTPGAPNPVCPADPSANPIRGNELLPGDLIITEAMFNPDSCPDYDAEYFEVYNASGALLDLNGLTMVINGDSVTLQGNYLIDEDTYAVAELYSGASPAGCYIGLTHDFLFDTAKMPDWGTEIRLLSDFGVIDTVDLTRRASVAGAALQLDADSISAAANDNVNLWCHATRPFQGSLGDFGSPKEENEHCPDAPDPVDTSDTGPEPEPEPAPVPVSALSAGDLIITELMFNPEDCADFAAEYVEIYNNTDNTVELTNLLVTIGAALDPVFQVNSTLAPRSYGTLRYTSGAAPACYGFTGNAWYQSSKMIDTGTTVRLSNGLVTFDEVFASGWAAIQPGHAMTLDPDLLDAALNDGADAWCSATSTFPGGLIDRGSPNSPNADCPAAAPGPTDTDVADTDGGPVAVPLVQASQLVAGDLVITELMANPSDCSDFAAEYIELYNRTDSRVDLTGLEVMVSGTTRVVTDVFDPIEPRSYGTLRYTTGASPACYGFDANAWYDASKMDDSGSNVRVSNGAGTIDQVLAAGWRGFTDGVALQLDPAFLDASLNDAQDAWCRSVNRFAGANRDLGSPAEENHVCAEIDTGLAGDTFQPADTGALAGTTAAGPLDPLFDLWQALFDGWVF